MNEVHDHHRSQGGAAQEEKMGRTIGLDYCFMNDDAEMAEEDRGHAEGTGNA